MKENSAREAQLAQEHSIFRSILNDYGILSPPMSDIEQTP
jgi:hypothetical protein